MMDTDKNEERDELRGRFTRFMEICVRNARSNYCKMLSREIPTISIEDVPERLLAEENPPEYKSGRDFDFEEEKLSEAFRTLPLMKRRILTMLFVEQLSPREIAFHLNCSVQYVYNQRSLALKSLRRIIANRSDDA